MGIFLGNKKLQEIYLGDKIVKEAYFNNQRIYPSFKVMTAVIDTSDSNPATCVAYADDAVNMTAGSSAWDEFFGHYPCILHNGVELGKLSPSDFAQYENGDSAPITTLGNDVMIAFPRLGVRITTENNKIIVSMTNELNNPDFKYYAHSRGDVAKDVFYLGAYKGHVSNGKLYSVSGKRAEVGRQIKNFRICAHDRGSGYEQSGFFQVLFRQCMYILKYKNLNSQDTIGKGYTGGSAKHDTGITNTKGMDYGSITSATEPVKLFGLEDFYGNIWEFVDGIVTDANRNILTATDNFNDSGSGYTNQGQGATSNIEGYIKAPQGTTETGFLIKTNGGSETTYFCDNAYLVASSIGALGGSFADGSKSGVFNFSMGNPALTTYNPYFGSRLMYLPA